MFCTWCFHVVDAGVRGLGSAQECLQTTTLQTKSKQSVFHRFICDSLQAGTPLHLCWNASSSVQQVLQVLGILHGMHFNYPLLFAITIVAYNTVYRACSYLEVVQQVAEESMQEAVDEVCTLPEYAAKGEVRTGHVLQHLYG